MMKIKFSNPIYFELKKRKLIHDKNLIKISNKTRDSNISVYKDKISGIIFLKDLKINNKYYRKKENSEKLIVNKQRFIQVNSFTKINKKKLISKNLDDDSRRCKQFNKETKNKKILDFGCGWGGFLNNIKNSKKLNGLEIREECFNFLNEKIKKINVFKNLNEVSERFDLITMFHVLEHLPEQIFVLKKLKKKLNKNGKIIIEVPHAKDFLLNLKGLKEFKNFSLWSEHLILHTEVSLRKFLSISGFKNIKIYYFQRYGFDNHLYWFINKKPGGHEFFKNNSSNKLNSTYKDYLCSKKITDTIFAEATI